MKKIILAIPKIIFVIPELLLVFFTRANQRNNSIYEWPYLSARQIYMNQPKPGVPTVFVM